MIEYLILQRLGEADLVWELTEVSEVKDAEAHIVKCPLTGDAMRAFLRFKAPNWEKAKTFFDLVTLKDWRPKQKKRVYEWEEVMEVINEGGQR